MCGFSKFLLILLLPGFSVKADILASYWSLDGNANDTAPNGATTDNGSFVGATSYGPGFLGQGIDLDGSNYISVPNSPDNDGKAMTLTISVWAKTDEFTIRKQTIVGQGESNDWRISRFDETNDYLFGGGPAPVNSTSNNFNDGQWHHLVGVAPFGSPVRFYIDGVQIATSTAGSFLNQNATRPMFIGSNPNRPDRIFNGQIDEVGIFHGDLSSEKIKAIYDLALNPTYQYTLDEVNEVFEIFNGGVGSSALVSEALWSYAASDPMDGRTFVKLAADGTGVAGERGPEVFSFATDRALIPSGFPITLTWNVDAFATNLSIDQSVGNVTANTSGGSGSITLNPGPSENTTYTLSAANADGLTTTETVTVEITTSPIIDVFSFSQDVISQGESSTLTWNVLNATGVTINGVAKGSSGSEVLSPSVSGTYEIVVTNPLDTMTQTISLNVVQPGVPILTEFLATNITGITDEDDDEEDWIQLTNPSAVDAVINGNYFLTDDPDSPRKWAIPAQTIPAGQSILIWASGKGGDDTPPSPAHTNFSLKEEGEYLALVKAEGALNVLITELNDYPRQFPDISYGVKDDLLTFTYYETPTPEGLNSGETFEDFARDTTFSVDRGFYDTDQAVEIETLTEGAQIYYTVDSTLPSAENGILYNSPIVITKTTTLRAIAVKDGWIPSNVDTQSYLFPAWTIEQPKFPQPELYEYEWPAGQIGEQRTDYRMKPAETVGTTDQGMIDALLAIPSISLVTDLANIYDNDTGIYARPLNRGRDWERPVSMELIYPPGYDNPDGPQEGFQLDCGFRIRGGASRDPFNNYKHGFRVFFRPEYGERALKYPLFGEEGTDEFRKIDLRCSQNYSWAFKMPLNGLNANEDNSTKNTFLRDVLVRDLQGALDQPYTRSRYYHLYLNGLYWGLYMTQERPEAHFGDSYLGGADEDYDTLKSSGGVDEHKTETADGNATDWTTAYNLAVAVGNDSPSSNTNYFALQGLNASGQRDAQLPIHYDIDNLIAYHLLIFYAGSFDGPLSAFLEEFENDPASNNWFALRNRARDDRGWAFMAHDMEHSLGTWPERTEDRTGPFWGENLADRSSFDRSNPQYIHQHLSNNLEYRMRFADLAQRELLNGGTLTNSNVLGMLAKRRTTVDLVIDAEAARWGDTQTPSEEVPLTRTDWTAAANQLEGWVVDRNLTLLAQLRADDLFPALDAPVLNRFGGSVTAGFNLTLSNPNGTGTIYYTTDGSDPREVGGALKAGVMSGTSLPINQSTTLMARVRESDASWSALVAVEFVVGQAAVLGDLVISEINYHPADPTASEMAAGFTSDEDFEFIEIHNTSDELIDLTNISIGNEITFSFASITDPAERVIGPGERIVLPRKQAAFSERYPGVTFPGDYAGKLSNSAGTIEIRKNNTEILFSVSYQDDEGWPTSADGNGKSLVLRNAAFPNQPGSWRASLANGGNPRSSDGQPFTGDPDGDDNGNGVSNLLEAVLRDESGAYFEPVGEIVSLDLGDGERDFLTLTVKYFPPVDNTTVVVERSSNLQENSWIVDGVTLISSATADDGTVTAIYGLVDDVDVLKKYFMRVRVNLNQ